MRKPAGKPGGGGTNAGEKACVGDSDTPGDLFRAIMAVMDDRLQEAKRRLRAEMKKLLASLTAGEIAEKSAMIVRAIESSSAWSRAEVVLAFLPLPGEADLRPLIGDALAAGKAAGLPRIDGEDLFFHAVTGTDPETGLARHAYGMLEPPPGAPALRPEDLAGRAVLVLVPGLAFDREGGRLGRGKGFYDRFLGGLAALREEGLEAGGGAADGGTSGSDLRTPGAGPLGRGMLVLGVGFASQIVDKVPTGAEDRRLDGVATEEGLLPAMPSDSETFVRGIVSKARKAAFLSSLKIFAAIVAGGILSAFLIVRLGGYFALDPDVVATVLVAAEAALALFAGYCRYRYVKAIREEDE